MLYRQKDAGSRNDEHVGSNDGGVRLDDTELIAPALYVIKSRTARRHHFPDGFFRPMTFDLILDLFIHRARGETVFVKQIIATSGLPQTSALRQIDRLEAFELVSRAPYEDDHRMIVLDLTETGWATMRKFLQSITIDAEIADDVVI